MALKPYLDDLVIIGGVAMRLYHFHANEKGSVPPLQTKDLDFATPRRLPVRRRKLVERLLVESGLEPIQTPVVGWTAPKVKYIPPEGEEEIEFLTDQVGKEREDSTPIQKGLFAEKKRYLGVLLDGTWAVDVGDGLTVRIPHPGRFIFQKILCFEKRRSPDKAAKDLYYFFYLLDQLTNWQGKIVAELTALKAHPKKWFTRFLAQVRDLFLEEDSPGPALVESQRTPGSAPEKAVFEELVRRRIREFHNALS
ncbi:MAG: GSU2403 family nucleotidyltransferase fold protein [Planctomycetota bacterium]